MGGSKKHYFDEYEVLLKKWAAFGSNNQKISAVYAYIQKMSVISDLIREGVLFVDNKEKLYTKWDKKTQGDAPPIFQVLKDQRDAFVRWAVEIPGVPESRVSRDAELWKSWEAYYLNQGETVDVCLVKGTREKSSIQHLAKIRHDGDRAKLISTNDTSNFTFLGRFTDSDQAASVSLQTSQKAHLALRWLVSRQGYRQDDLAIVAWCPEVVDPIPQPTEDTYSLLYGDDVKEGSEGLSNTAQDTANRLRMRIAGYGKIITGTSQIVIMGMDSATPGRLSIIFYRKLSGSAFLKRIDDWHTSCAWMHRYRSASVFDPETGKTEWQKISFIGAPAPKDIAEAVYGVNNNGKLHVDDKLRKATTKRLLPCIIDGHPIPRDMVESAVRRVSNKIGRKMAMGKEFIHRLRVI